MKQVIQDDSGLIHPAIVVADTGQTGVPVYGTLDQAGGGFIALARTDECVPLNFNFVNLGAPFGEDLPNGSGSMNVGIWSLQPDQVQAQGMLNFFTATGHNWQGISAVSMGTQLGEVAFWGCSTHGMIQTESASIWAVADQDFSDTGPVPLETNTKCGTNLVFRVCDRDRGYQRVTQMFDAKGNFVLGTYQDHGNNFPAKRTIVMQEAEQPPTASVPWTGFLFIQDGALKYRGPAGTVTTLAHA